MDYEHKAKTVADCLLSYKRDESGWKVCKKSVNVCCLYGLLRNDRILVHLCAHTCVMLEKLVGSLVTWPQLVSLPDRTGLRTFTKYTFNH